MTGRKNRALQVPPVVSYKALENFSKALYETTGGTCSARFFRPVMWPFTNSFHLYRVSFDATLRHNMAQIRNNLPEQQAFA